MPVEAHIEAAQNLQSQAYAAYGQGRFAAAVDAFTQAIARLDDAGLAPHAMVLVDQANARLNLGQLEQAGVLYERAEELARQQGYPVAEASAYYGQGLVQQQRGDTSAALGMYEAAAELFEEAGDIASAAQTMGQRGALMFTEKRFQDAATAYEGAIIRARSTGSPHLLCTILVSAGGVLVALNQHDEAAGLLEEAAAALPEEYAATHTEMVLRKNQGLAHLALGRFDQARAAHLRARQLAVDSGDMASALQLEAGLSDIQRFQGDLTGAIAHHRAMMALEAAHGVIMQPATEVIRTGITDQSLGMGTRMPAGRVRAESTHRTFAHLNGAHLNGALTQRRPFVILVPPVVGGHGPLFPRGATAIASYLGAHGIPALVVPLSHYVEPHTDTRRRDAIARELVEDLLSTLRPRAVGLSVTFSHLYPAGLRLGRLVREIAGPELPIIIGGPHVTYWDRECLEEAPYIDVVVRGEGEWTALELLRALERGEPLDDIFGLTFRAPDGSLRRTRNRKLGDVLELPPVDFDLLPRDFAGRMEVSGVTSRGCAYRCRFCHEFRFWGGAVREYAPERIVDEMRRLNGLGNRMLGIDDSMLSMQSEYFYRLCEHLSGTPYLGDDFGFLTRVHTITPDGVRAMKRARIASVAVGLESGSEVVLKAMNKGVGLEETMAGLRYARDQGGGDVRVSAFFIVGHPGDSPSESETTIRFADQLFADDLASYLDVAMFNPYPGTPFFIAPEKHGVEILTMDWERWRRTNRPIAQLKDYPASGIYLSYLRMLELMERRQSAG